MISNLHDLDISNRDSGESIQKNLNELKKKIERKRVSFDLRVDIHKQLKMKSIIEEKNIYELIEEALENYLNK